jgi:hypothetical protein
MKKKMIHCRVIALAIAIGCSVMLPLGCANMTPQEQSLVVSAESLAAVAGTAAATYYGGQQAGELASSGLSALGSVLQGYVGMTVPTSIIQNSPGIAGVGSAIAAALPKRTVSQTTVNTINQAAAIASTLKASDLVPIYASATPTPASSPSPSSVSSGP